MVTDPILCLKCVNALERAYTFRTRCLKIEDEIINYLCAEPRSTGDVNESVKIDLGHLKQYLKDNKKNVDAINSLILKKEEEFVDVESVVKEEKIEKHVENFEIKEESSFEDIEIKDEIKTEYFEEQDHITANEISPTGFNSNLELKGSKRKNKRSSNLSALQCKGCKIKSWQAKDHGRAHNEVYSCANCNTIFDHIEDIRRHIYKHTLPCVCDICGKRSRDTNSHKVHLASHLNQKPFTCSICQKSFKQKHAMTQHSTIHNPKQSMKCEICSKVMSSKYNLKVHMTLHTGKQFRCEYCKGNFLTNSILRKHQQSSCLYT